MENVQFEPCVIERLMRIHSPLKQKQPIGKCRALSGSYLQKMQSVETRKRRFNENRLSWMETDGPVFDESLDVSTSYLVEHEQCFSHPVYFSDALNSLDSEKLGMPECELSRVCSTENSGCCLSPATSEVAKRNVMDGHRDSFRLIRSLQDYLSGNARKPYTDDKKRKLSNTYSPQPFKFRRRIYMDPEKEVAAHTKCLRGNLNWSNLELEDFTATRLIVQGHSDHRRLIYNTPSYNLIDPCFRALQALKDKNTSKVPKYDHTDAVTLKNCVRVKLRPVSYPGMKVAMKNSTTLESLAGNRQDFGLHPSFSARMVRQKTHNDVALSVSSLVHPNGRIHYADQFSSDHVDGRITHQDSMPALPGIAMGPLFSQEPPSPRSSEEACQHSPDSVLKPLSNADELSDSEHFKHVSPELLELRMQLQLLETEFPKGVSESYVTTYLNNEDNPVELWTPLLSPEQEAIEMKDLPKKELVRDSRWLDLQDEIHAVGTQIESLLIDDLIKEIVFA